MDRQWVYIYRDTDRQMIIGTTADAHHLLEIMQGGKEILYLCMFRKAFDALAHKCLLEELGCPTIQTLVDRNKEKTDLWLCQLTNLYNNTI